MVWKKRKKKRSIKPRFSFIEKLRKSGHSNDKFEIMLNNLSLEDIIAIKLELSSKNAAHHLYGIPIWQSVNRIVKNAIYNFAKSTCNSPLEVCTFLDITALTYYNLEKKYNYKKEKSHVQENPSN